MRDTTSTSTGFVYRPLTIIETYTLVNSHVSHILYISEKGLSVEWTQSNEDVTMKLRVDKLKESDLKKIDVSFSDNDVTFKLPGICYNPYSLRYNMIKVNLRSLDMYT